jgi:hypothetical protein
MQIGPKYLSANHYCGCIWCIDAVSKEAVHGQWLAVQQSHNIAAPKAIRIVDMFAMYNLHRCRCIELQAAVMQQAVL